MDRGKVIKSLKWFRDRDSWREGIMIHDDHAEVRKQICDNAIAMLKEKEAIEPKTGHWIFESAYCEAWSHTCSECGKRMTTAYNTYANYCWNCGAKMEGR